MNAYAEFSVPSEIRITYAGFSFGPYYRLCRRSETKADESTEPGNPFRTSPATDDIGPGAAGHEHAQNTGLPWAQIEAAQESERRRIARELHDDLGQQLAALKMALAATIAGFDGYDIPLDVLARANDLCVATDQLLQSVRRIANGLRPAILDNLGLQAALEWLTDSFRYRTGLGVVFDDGTNGMQFNDDAATALFRIAQEGVNNVARHARDASGVAITLVCDAGVCRMEIVDDGLQTVSLAMKGDASSSGLAGIRERVRSLGGSVVMESLGQRGFRIVVMVPCDAVTIRSIEE